MVRTASIFRTAPRRARCCAARATACYRGQLAATPLSLHLLNHAAAARGAAGCDRHARVGFDCAAVLTCEGLAPTLHMPAAVATGQRLQRILQHLMRRANDRDRAPPIAPPIAPAAAAAAAAAAGPLSLEQLAVFDRDGFLLASGLMSKEVASEAEQALWDLMELDPRAADPASWRSLPYSVVSKQAATPGSFGASNVYNGETGLVVTNGVQQPNIMATASESFLSAMAQLLGKDTVPRPQAAHTQHKLPRPGAARPPPQPHVDGIPKEQMNKVFPGPYRVTALLFLSDVDGTKGGGTAVWPQSHKKIRQLAESDPIEYEYLWRLTQDVPTIEGLGDPITLVPQRGDVLFFQHLFGHNGTPNTSQSVRLCLRFFCSCNSCINAWRKTEAWGHWCPDVCEGEAGWTQPQWADS